jgi:hypothetical protein
MCHPRMLMDNGMRSKLLSPSYNFFDFDMEGDAIARSKGLLDIQLIKMVSETVLVKVNGIIIMTGVWNIKNSRTSLGWGVYGWKQP